MTMGRRTINIGLERETDKSKETRWPRIAQRKFSQSIPTSHQLHSHRISIQQLTHGTRDRRFVALRLRCGARMEARNGGLERGRCFRQSLRRFDGFGTSARPGVDWPQDQGYED